MNTFWEKAYSNLVLLLHHYLWSWLMFGSSERPHMQCNSVPTLDVPTITIEHDPLPSASELGGDEGLQVPGLMVDVNQSSSLESPSIYRVNSAIGQGSFSDVYPAQLVTKGVKVHVVVKFLRRFPNISKADLAQDIQHEANVLKSLCHPNVCSFYGIMADVGSPEILGIVMEQLEHDLLTYAFEHQGMIPHLISQVCQGVQHIHYSGIIHGDIHPGNLRVTSSGVAVIIDFGLSRCVHTTEYLPTYLAQPQRHGRIFNNPRFAAPELLNTDEEWPSPTKATDVFALAMTILTTNREPKALTLRPYSNQILNRAYYNVHTLNGTRDMSIPYNHIALSPHQFRVLRYAAAGRKPILDNYEGVREKKRVRALLERCWETNPSLRPTIDVIIDIWNEECIPEVHPRTFDLTAAVRGVLLLPIVLIPLVVVVGRATI
ncbi:kinase-like protein [Coprinopsis marcescibilis]|uniref:Kinase-like protein n=1 Tax=Coprinopsis marcescibilis TaxID=230819 RepID=A0A5C3KHF3_COPMA|nr:kinase-like protein [Coprinopsis marcescibilis]